MSVGIRLKFFRDRAFQFPIASDSSEAMKDFWWVLGSPDYLAAETLQSLDDIDSTRTHDSWNWLRPDRPLSRLPPFGPTGELILVPDPWNAERPENLVTSQMSLLGQKHDAKNDLSVLFILRLSLSSLAIETPAEVTEVPEVLRSISTIVSDAWKPHSSNSKSSPNTWLTLGGPDAVVLAFADAPGDLSSLGKLVSRLRETTLATLRETLRSKFPQIRLNDFSEGHAFSAVQANVAFRFPETGLADIITESAWLHPTAETELGLAYPSRITTGPGHEISVASRIATACNNDPSLAVSWGHRSVQVQFKRLIDVVRALHLAIAADGNRTTGPPASAAEVTTFRTTITTRCEPQHDATTHRRNANWSPKLEEALESIVTSFSRFAKRHLDASRQLSLHQVLLTFLSALQRNDRACSVRDLLPYFIQLSRLLSETISTNEGEDVAVRFSDVTTFLMHALRNRVEYRSEPLDPSFPNTLEYGASKLINAHTVTAWLVWEQLTRNDINRDLGTPGTMHCASEFFGTAVRAGNSGSVTGVRLLPSWQKLRPNEKAVIRKWNAPLSHLTISGPILFQPEIALASCAHEIAELNNWLQMPASAKTLSAIYRWVRTTFIDVVTSYLARCDLAANGIANPDSADLKRRCNHIASLNERILLQLTNDTPPPLTKQGDWMPFSALYSQVQNSLPDRTSDFWSMHHLQPPAWLKEYHTLFNSQCGLIEKFLEFIQEGDRVLSEVLPDLAMCLVVSRFSNDHSPQAWTRNVDHIFSVIWKCTNVGIADIATPRAKYCSHIERWTMMRYCQVWTSGDATDESPPSDRRNATNTEPSISDSFRSAIKEPGAMIGISDELLDTALEMVTKPPFYGHRSLQTTIGEIIKSELQLPFGDLTRDSVTAHLVEHFRAAWNIAVYAPRHGSNDVERLKMILAFWGKSQRFCLQELFAATDSYTSAPCTL